MNADSAAACVLVIGDDPAVTAAVGAELRAGGYDVRLATALLETIASASPDPDLIVLCGLAVIAHPGQSAVPILRVPDGLEPAAVVEQVHRRITLRAVLQAAEDAAA